ncbi:MAG: AAA family ATPase [Paracoccaceae bacterium]
MNQELNIGSSIQPLRNVAALMTLTNTVQHRAFGLPGIGVFYGHAGLGKTSAASYATIKSDAVYIAMQRTWTAKSMLKQILMEMLNHEPRGTIPDLANQVNSELLRSGRMLIIDEADYAVEKNLIDHIRDIHDNSQCAVVLIGEEKMPQKLRKWERFHDRVLKFVAAEPCDLKDAKMLAKVYAAGLTVHDDLMTSIVEQNQGNSRRISRALANVYAQCRVEGISDVSASSWGNRALTVGETPKPRKDL